MEITKKFGIKQLIPLLSAAVAVIFLVLGFAKYGFWDEFKGPKPGFLPIIISIALLAVSVLAFIGSFKEKHVELPRENWLCALGLLAIVAASFIIGMELAILVYLIIWLHLYEKQSWKTTIIATVVIMAIVIGAFDLWLGIDFPKGIIYDLIFG